ncbi:MAG: FecR family protein [Gemmatimonadaceae bacterium]
MTDRPPAPDSAPDWEALARYQAGESPEAEARAVRAWLAAHPAVARMLWELDAVITADIQPSLPFEAGAAGEVDVEAALARLKARRGAEEGGPEMPARVIPLQRRQARVSRRAAWGGLGIAAAAAGVIGVALVMHDADGARLAAAGSAVTTSVGQRDSVRLPDGSRVVLAPGSRVTVARGYGEGARTVTLDGMALFTVRHDGERPFTVRAGGALVRDVGTVFTVRTDGVGGDGVAVSATEGAVALREAGADGPNSASEVVLRAGDRGELRPGAVPLVTRGAAGADDAAWARGRLSYRAVPLEQVRADLRRWYGLELQVDDPALAGRRITATFDQADPPSRVLDVVALSLGATVERFGSTAVLRAAERRP